MKRNTTELIEEISDFLAVYLKSGKLGLNSFIKKAHLNIDQLEQLIQIHFLLKVEVKDYVARLPKLIQRFKTSTAMVKETYEGQVKGQIDWQGTIKERLNRDYRNRTLFSCNERSRNYAIKENLVLKHFIEELYKLLFRSFHASGLSKYSWFSDWEELKFIIDHIYHKNIYLSRVRLDDVTITDRMLQDTARNRNPLYREAASLLILYRKLLARKLNETEIRQLLQETFVFPDRQEVLFELYWAIQMIKSHSKDAKLELLDGRKNLFASWKDEQYHYQLYHDSAGSRNIKFKIATAEVRRAAHPIMNKQLSSMERAAMIAKHSFGSAFGTETYWSGRPDIILEVYKRETNELKKVVLGEVKHTANVDYAITGLRELTDYIEFIKNRNGDYLSDFQEIDVKGVLFLDHVHIRETRVEDIFIINHGNKDVVAHILKR